MSTVAERMLMRLNGAHIVSNFLLCYHPTTVIFVDDEEFVINNLEMRFKGKFLYKLFISSTESLKFVQEFKYPDFKAELMEPIKGSENHKFNFHKIHHMIYDAKRFERPAVICVDQNMPKMDGFELCRLLMSLPLLKLMFTGKASFQACQQAYHDGIINAFIHKDAGGALEALDKRRDDFQNNFFSVLGCHVVLPFVLQLGVDHYLFNDKFMGLIKEVQHASQSVERYLLDTSGSYLFLNSRGDVNALIVRSDADIQAALKANEQAKNENKAPADVIEAIKSDKKILYTGTGDDLSVPPKEWGKYLFDAEAYEIADTKIYYAYVSGRIPGIDRSKIVSYDAYMAERKAS